ncbi:hypothetical protein [Pseudoalteromonas luteoviolacea]|uniref:Uncharacterized protein n=1 Tax=Pseudoalteromonas luteoviolacea H33 TaxID=1365251 RepID=A0A167E513_9GAMM|nr:hypothetical protein [Pseudoalteromonas luteoviolacea]KZN50053.1 hypothetical protein N476_17040 [Pseudoalteromonas luteoviolacea H33]KZN76373.1 hypothetical protein N477_16845 [Pseudoalteromonas luteoviolacea H33-S]
MYEIYSLVDHGQLAFVALGLLLSWKSASARWFIISYAVVIIFNLASYPISSQWNTHYYLFQAGVNVVFMLPIVYRRNLALYIYEKTNIDFYKQVHDKQILSSQECMIALVFILAILVNLVTWCEVMAYKYSYISNAYFKLHFRDNIVLCVQLVLCTCLLSYARKAESRELGTEEANS